MIEFETEEFRTILPLIAPNANFEKAYTFYYDETNNIKKFHLKNGDFNVAFSSNFVLGGLAFTGNLPDIHDIFDGLRLQHSTTEVKLKHVATGDFLDCLRSTKLTMFLEYIAKSSLYLHFSSLNLLYYSIVDIVDSAITASVGGDNIDPYFIRKLKNDLYKICRIEIKEIVPLFVRYNYPNVGKTDLLAFIDGLLSLFVKYENLAEYKAAIKTIKQLLKAAKNEGELVFVMDNNSYMLIDGLLEFYMRPIYYFLNSKHIFDNEADISAEIAKYNITFKGSSLTNYTFLDSKTDQLIQASDIIIGLVGKFSKFLNTNTAEEIEGHIEKLSDLQKGNLDLYIDLVLKSEKENPGFFHFADSDDDHSKNELIFRIRSKL